MRRLGMISIVAAALLFVGCGNKEEHKAQTEQKSVEHKVEAPQPAAKPQSAPAPKAEAPKAEAPKAEAAKPEAKPAAEQATEAAKEVAQKAKESVQEAKEKVVESAKEAVAAATGAATAPAAAKSGDLAAKGKELYAKCASCHGPKGNLKALNKSGIIAGMPKDEIVKKLKGYKAGTLNQYGMGGLMKGQVATLSDADIEALAAYISSLK